MKPPGEPLPRGLVAPDLTLSLPTFLRKRLAESHEYFLPSIPRNLMKPKGLRGGATSQPPHLCLTYKRHQVCFPRHPEATTTTLFHGLLET